MRSSCVGREAFCGCSDRRAGLKKARTAARTRMCWRMVVTGPTLLAGALNLVAGGVFVTVWGRERCPKGYRSEGLGVSIGDRVECSQLLANVSANLTSDFYF